MKNEPSAVDLTEKTLQDAIDHFATLVDEQEVPLTLTPRPTMCSRKEYAQIKDLPENEQVLALWKNRLKKAEEQEIKEWKKRKKE